MSVARICRHAGIFCRFWTLDTYNWIFFYFFRHSLSAQTISHGSLLEAITSGSRSDSNYLKKRPHVTMALLEFVELIQRLIGSRGKPEECLNLTGSLMPTVQWLLKYVLAMFEIFVSLPKNQTGSEVDLENVYKCLNIVSNFIKDDFTLNLLYVSKIEDKENSQWAASFLFSLI
jgi:hypothetical protein